MLMSNSCSSPIILLLIVWTTILRLFGPCSATLAPRPWMQSLATGQQHPTWQSVAACFRHSWCLPGYSQVARRMRPAWHFKSFYSTRTSIYTNPIKINLQILNRKRASHSRGTSGGLGFQTWWIVKKKKNCSTSGRFLRNYCFSAKHLDSPHNILLQCGQAA